MACWLPIKLFRGLMPYGQLAPEPIGVDFFAFAERGLGPVQGTADESLDQRFGKELLLADDG